MKRLILIGICLVLVAGCSFHGAIAPDGFRMSFTLEEQTE
jgi:hypothetical protein